MNFPFAHLVPDKYRHTFEFNLTDPEGSYLLRIDYVENPQAHFGIDIRLKGDDMAMTEREFATHILVPAIVALEQRERAGKVVH